MLGIGKLHRRENRYDSKARYYLELAVPGDSDKRTDMQLSEKARCGIPETAEGNTETYREVSSDRNIYGVESVNQPNDRRA